MRILIIMNPGLPVPPLLYGGIERIVYLLAEEYHKMGHEVTLLAGPDSYCSGRVIPFGANKTATTRSQEVEEVFFVWKYLMKNQSKFDLIHNFGRLIYFLPIVRKEVKKIMSYQRPVSVKGIKFMTSVGARQLTFTGCSNYCVSTGNVAGRWETVYNALEFSQYQTSKKMDPAAPLMFLGRLDMVKGVHTAIEVAKKTNNTLFIGGNIPGTRDNYEYYKEIIEPQIDNEQIVYLGALNDNEKNHYLGKSKALLFPIQWDEPFGIVMIEAMACGTPVIAFKRGAVPEVVVDGVNGNIVNSKEEMIKAVNNLKHFDRAAVRDYALKRFNIGKIAGDYLKL